jgi:hypothetical protein
VIIKRNGSLTTGTTLNPNNVWSGSAFEYLKGPAIYGRNNAVLANDFYIQAGGVGGDRIVSTLRNPTAGTVAYDAIALITPVGGGRRR